MKRKTLACELWFIEAMAVENGLGEIFFESNFMCEQMKMGLV